NGTLERAQPERAHWGRGRAVRRRRPGRNGDRRHGQGRRVGHRCRDQPARDGEARWRRRLRERQPAGWRHHAGARRRRRHDRGDAATEHVAGRRAADRDAMTAERTVLSVSQLTDQLRGVVEEKFPAVWVEGEISNFRLYSSGPAYFTLKDEKAALRAVLVRT